MEDLREKNRTVRQEIVEALSSDSMDLREISQRFRIREKEILEHLQHISRSAYPLRLVIEPSQCRRCGFVYKKRQRLNTPSRCPICRSESITPARYRICRG
jgi:predicted Zn-ribbon and HTH transcriptional regulator